MRAIAIWGALLLVGCAGHPRALETLRVLPRAASLGEQSLRLEVEVTNPNDRPVALRAVDWTISARDLPSLRGRLELDEPIPPRGRRELALSLRRPTELPVGPLRVEGLFHFGGGIAAPFSQGVAR